MGVSSSSWSRERFCGLRTGPLGLGDSIQVGGGGGGGGVRGQKERLLPSGGICVWTIPLPLMAHAPHLRLTHPRHGVVGKGAC